MATATPALREEHKQHGYDPRLMGARCSSCPLQGQVPVPPTTVRRGARFIIIGEGPGRLEQHRGRPFIGASGKMLDMALKKAGLMRSQAHITNAMACRTDDERPETKLAATSCCAPRLAAELQAAAPRMRETAPHEEEEHGAIYSQGSPQPILALGAYALRATLGVNGIQKARGFFWETGEVSEKKLADAHKSLKRLLQSNRGKPSAVTLKRAEKRKRSVWLLEARAKLAGRWVIPTVHPAFILRGADGWLPVFYNDVKRFKRLLDAEDVYACLEDDAPYKVAGTAEAVTKLVARLRGVLAVDVETTGPSPLLDRLLCIGISDGVRTVEVFPWNRKLLAKALRQAFSGRTLVMHNGPQFDQIVLRREGVL